MDTSSMPVKRPGMLSIAVAIGSALCSVGQSAANVVRLSPPRSNALIFRKRQRGGSGRLIASLSERADLNQRQLRKRRRRRWAAGMKTAFAK